ncbi:hypothetical protein VSK91_19745 [Bacillus swezeyi]|uniref:hypothetical protein n=1 Tax=Bacillus swezeyi TaxID=1925020 RepID=UPI002E234379|nr:hypothetical protein [Bacillus swezeyi]MED2979637.1 hypothetical protein [Bacillus swezeyi]
MYIRKQTKKQIIEVFHNNFEEMRENIKQLEQEGWSGNTRSSIAGITLYELKLRSDEKVRALKSVYPDINVYYHEKDSLIHDYPYVLYTVHEREIE